MTHRTVLAIPLLASLTLVVAACGTNNFEGEGVERAVRAIERRIGAKQVRALTVKVTKRQVVVRAQNPKKPTKVQHWWHFKGKPRGPRKVTLLGGSLEASLWPLETVDFAKVASIVKRAEQMWGKKVVSMEIRIPKYVRWGNKLRWTVRFKGGAYTYATPDGNTVTPRATRR